MGTLSPASPQISPSDGEAGPQQDCPASGYFVVAVPQGCPPLGMVLPWQRHPKTLGSQAGAKPGIPTRTPLTPRGCSGSPQQRLCPKALLSAAKLAPRRTREAPKRNKQMGTEDSVLLGGRSLILGDMPACTPGAQSPQPCWDRPAHVPLASCPGRLACILLLSLLKQAVSPKLSRPVGTTPAQASSLEMQLRLKGYFPLLHPFGFLCFLPHKNPCSSSLWMHINCKCIPRFGREIN